MAPLFHGIRVGALPANITSCATPTHCHLLEGEVLLQSFDPFYVGLSLLVAAAGAFTALTITVHLKHVRSQFWYAIFVLCAGMALGYSTVWSMHFVGMYALHLVTADSRYEVPITFDVLFTVTSAVAAWLISALGLHILAGRSADDRGKLDRVMLVRWLGSSALIATGVCVMHYMGMASQSGYFRMEYWLPVVVASAIVALVAASAGLIILLFFPSSLLVRLLSSLVISVAVNGMHYTGMASAQYVVSSTFHIVIPWDATINLSAMAIAGFALLLNQVLYIVGIQYETLRKDIEDDVARQLEYSKQLKLSPFLLEAALQPRHAMVLVRLSDFRAQGRLRRFVLAFRAISRHSVQI